MRDRIIQFLKWKSEELSGECGLEIFKEEEDAQDILEMTDNQVEAFHYDLISFIFMKDKRVDSQICPWCTVYDVDCKTCPYGRRHEVCDDDDSIYTRIRDSFPEERSLVGVLGENRVISKIQEIFELGVISDLN